MGTKLSNEISIKNTKKQLPVSYQLYLPVYQTYTRDLGPEGYISLIKPQCI